MTSIEMPGYRSADIRVYELANLEAAHISNRASAEIPGVFGPTQLEGA